MTELKTAASGKPSVIELPSSAVLGPRCPRMPSGSALLGAEALLARPGSSVTSTWRRPLWETLLSCRASPAVPGAAGTRHRFHQTVSPQLLPEGDHLADGLFSHGCESLGNGGERGRRSQILLLDSREGSGTFSLCVWLGSSSLPPPEVSRPSSVSRHPATLLGPGLPLPGPSLPNCMGIQSFQASGEDRSVHGSPAHLV